MATTLPTIDRETLTALRASDEHALEQIFRADYPWLVSEATDQLGDASSAPRLAEDVVLSVWDHRESVDTPEAFNLQLTDAIHAAVLREKRRRGSLVRIEAHEAAPHQRHGHAAASISPDDAWNEIVAILHRSHVDTAEFAAQKVTHARHEAASHLATVGKADGWKRPVLVFLSFVLFIGAVFALVEFIGADAAVASAVSGPEAVTRTTRAGQRGTVTLDGGSTVSIGSETVLTTPKDETAKFRAAKIIGAAAFTIASADRRFEVLVGDVRLRANAAKIEVRHFPEENAVLARVTEGSALLTTAKEKRTLKPGDMVAVAKDGTIRTAGAAEIADAFSWVDGKISFTAKPLRAVVPEVQRWYDYMIDVRDKGILDRKLTFTADLTSVKDVIAALETGAGAKFGFDGKTPVLRDAKK